MRLLEEAHYKKSFFINLDCTHISNFDRALYNKLVSYPTVMPGPVRPSLSRFKHLIC